MSAELDEVRPPHPHSPAGASPAPPWSWPGPRPCAARSAGRLPSGRLAPGPPQASGPTPSWQPRRPQWLCGAGPDEEGEVGGYLPQQQGSKRSDPERSLSSQGGPPPPSPRQWQTLGPTASRATPGSEPAPLQSGGARGAYQWVPMPRTRSISPHGLPQLLEPGTSKPAVRGLQPMRSGPDLVLVGPELQPETDPCWHPSCQLPSLARDASASTPRPLAGLP